MKHGRTKQLTLIELLPCTNARRMIPDSLTRTRKYFLIRIHHHRNKLSQFIANSCSVYDVQISHVIILPLRDRLPVVQSTDGTGNGTRCHAAMNLPQGVGRRMKSIVFHWSPERCHRIILNCNRLDPTGSRLRRDMNGFSDEVISTEIRR